MKIAATLLLGAMVVACHRSSPPYTTNVEIVAVEPFKDETGTPRMYALELRYADCPGDARRFLRADASFSKCAEALKPGARAQAELISRYSAERGTYRSDITRLGDCALAQDPKDEANYETLQTCTDVKASGFTVGVRCDRTRSKELLAKCPWLRR